MYNQMRRKKLAKNESELDYIKGFTIVKKKKHEFKL